jgi:hypothetical protein
MKKGIMKSYIIVLAISFAVLTGTTHGGIDLTGGLSILTFQVEDVYNWNPGLSIGLNIQKKLNPYVQLGLRSAFNFWTPNAERIKSNFDPGMPAPTINGSANVIQVTPIIHFSSNSSKSANFFCQLGGGIYFVNIDGKAMSSNGGYTQELYQKIKGVKFGINVGLGPEFLFKNGIKMQFYPEFHLPFPVMDNLPILAFNLGVGKDF